MTISATVRPSRHPPIQDDLVQLARSRGRQDPPRTDLGAEIGYTSCTTPRHRRAGGKCRRATAPVDNPTDGHDVGYQVYGAILRKKQSIET